MLEMLKELKRLQETMERRFAGWTNIQNGIASHNRAIEFRRTGAIRYDLFTGKFGNEKGVDVKLATDLINLKDIYDVAIIVSGDQDYVPAVEAIKNYGKRVINVAFEDKNGRMLPGGARRLNQATDWSINLKHNDIGGYLGILKKSRGFNPIKHLQIKK